MRLVAGAGNNKGGRRREFKEDEKARNGSEKLFCSRRRPLS